MTDIEKAIHSMHNLNMVLSITESERCAVNSAIQALQEKAERDKGCVWCKENNKVFHDGQHFHMFCSYCGRRLEVKHE